MTDAFKGITTVLFDIDGVLVDSKDSNAAFYQALVKKAGYEEPPLETAHKYFHTPLRKSLQELLGIDAEEVERIMAMARDADVSNVHLLRFPDDVHDILAKLSKRYRLGVVTSRTQGGMEEIFEIMGIGPLFEVAVNYDDSAQHKPHPEPLQIAMRQLGVSADEAVYVGDGITDIDAAHAAGMRSIFLSNDHHDHASLHIRKFNELQEVLL